MHVLILAHGEMPSASLLRTLCEEADLFLATDGAANALPDLGMAPHVILGDFDSVAARAGELFPTAEFIHTPDQEASDLDKALMLAIERGATRVTLAGALGGRIDHTLVNVGLLVKYAGRLDLRIVDDWGETRATSDSLVISGHPGDTLSVAVFAPAEGVTLTGVRWPLHDERLLPGSRAVSNSLVEESARLSVREGVLIVTHLRTGGADREEEDTGEAKE